MTTPRETPKENLTRQVGQADRLLNEAQRVLTELAQEKRVTLIREDAAQPETV